MVIGSVPYRVVASVVCLVCQSLSHGGWGPAVCAMCTGESNHQYWFTGTRSYVGIHGSSFPKLQKLKGTTWKSSEIAACSEAAGHCCAHRGAVPRDCLLIVSTVDATALPSATFARDGP